MRSQDGAESIANALDTSNDIAREILTVLQARSDILSSVQHHHEDQPQRHATTGIHELQQGSRGGEGPIIRSKSIHERSTTGKTDAKEEATRRIICRQPLRPQNTEKSPGRSSTSKPFLQRGEGQNAGTLQRDRSKPGKGAVKGKSGSASSWAKATIRDCMHSAPVLRQIA